jgi:hypothetical protein
MTRIQAAAAATLVAALANGCGEPGVLSPPTYACFVVENPYAYAGQWVRGNFHVHTWHSDGAYSGRETVSLYGVNGYGALCITDHNCFGDQDGGIVPALQTDATLHDWNGDGILHPERRMGSGVEAYVRDWTQLPPPWARDDWFLTSAVERSASPVLLSGLEGSIGGFHVGCIGHPPGQVAIPGASPTYIQRTRRAGGFVYLAHPGEWNATPGNLPRAFDPAPLHGLEIANGLRLTEAYPRPPQSARQPAERNGTRPAGGAADAGDDACGAQLPWDATPLWDGLLARGYRMWGLANDDSHTWPGADKAYPFSAFNMVLLGEHTPDGVLQALHRGSSYASTGLYFGSLVVRDDSLLVWAPEAQRIRFIGWNGRILRETLATRDAYKFTGDEGYVRVEATGVAGRTLWPPQAWSQPFYVQGVPCGAATAFRRRDSGG